MSVKKLNGNLVALATLVLYLGIAATTCSAAESYVVTYRLSKQKTAHFDDAKTAKTLAATVERLGGKAKQASHGGHYDVSYVCPNWKQISLKSSKDAHQWAHWLAASSFETLFIEPPQSGHLETVAFRMPASKSAHFDRRTDAQSDADTLKMLGCDVKQGSHSGHYDVTYRCPKWRTIGLESHDDAHKWEKWLKAKGFETRHDHKNIRNARVRGK